MPGDDLYESGSAEMPDAGANDKPADDKKPDEGGETALIPSSLCPGMKPGEEVVLKINRVLDDQYEVSYAPKEKEGGKEDAGEVSEPPAPAPGGLASMGGGGMYE